MSYEGTHWLCSHGRKDCDGRCRDTTPPKTRKKKRDATTREMEK